MQTDSKDGNSLPTSSKTARRGNRVSRFALLDNCFFSLVFRFLFAILCVVVIIVGGVTIVEAFCEMKETNLEVKAILCDVKEELRRLIDINCSNTELPHCEALHERLESTCKKTLNENTIAFLFPVLSVTLLSAGALLLDRSQRNVRLSERRSDNAQRTVDDARELLQDLERSVPGEIKRAEQRFEDIHKKHDAAEKLLESAGNLASELSRKFDDVNQQASDLSRNLRAFKQKYTEEQKRAMALHDIRFHTSLILVYMTSAYHVSCALRSRKEDYLVSDLRQWLKETERQLQSVRKTDLRMEKREHDESIALCEFSARNIRQLEVESGVKDELTRSINEIKELLDDLDPAPESLDSDSSA